MRPVRLLTLSSLFPNPVQPRHGIFVAERLRQLLRTGAVVASVVAPVPWFPSTNPRFGRYAEFARIPPSSDFEGCSVLHPRYPTIPKLGMSVAPLLMAQALMPLIRRLSADCDVIDAHFLYPDGIAATLLGRRLDKPVLLTARGSDVNQFGEFVIPRRWLSWAVRRADHVFAVSRPLAKRIVDLGATQANVSVSPNGVDLTRFSPRDRLAARARLGLDPGRGLLLAVGNLLELKGHHLMIEALTGIREFDLIILGEGPRRPMLEAQITQLGLEGRVTLPGVVAQDALPDYYSAADLTLLASSREGMPNVVLESLACGTRVVATPVGGVPDVIDAPVAGQLVSERSSNAFQESIQASLALRPDPAATRRHAERFAWKPVIDDQVARFRRAAGLTTKA